MEEQVFDQRRCAETLSHVLEALLADWATLPPSVQHQIEQQRRSLWQALPGLQPFQRAGRIIEFLKALEAMPDVLARCQSILLAGKGPSYRMLVTLGDEQVRNLMFVLARPVAIAEANANGVQRVAFQLHVRVAPRPDANAPLPVVAHLAPDTRPREQQVDAILVPFADPTRPTELEVTLHAPGFGEQSGDWTRTLLVYPAGPSLPAVFLLEPGALVGAQSLWFHFSETVGSALRQVEIVSPMQAKSIAPPDPTRGPTRGVSTGGTEVEFHTAVGFPAQALTQTVQPLTLRLTREAVEGSRMTEKTTVSFADVNRAELLEVVVGAMGFAEWTQNPRRAFRLYSHADSQPAIFLLQAGDQTGEMRITLDVYHQGRLLLSGGFVAEIVAQLGAARAQLQPRPGAGVLEPIPAAPPPPPDLELRILFDPLARRLRFRLHAQNAELGYHDRDLGEVQLAADPQQILDQTYRELSALAAQAPAAPADADGVDPAESIANLGHDLFSRLFSPQLRQEYWRIKALREAGKVQTLLIISQEPWIPWEMVKPFAYDRATDLVQEDGFLAEVFHLARWLTPGHADEGGRGMAATVDVQAARLVAPSSNLAYTKEELAFFDSLRNRGLDVGSPLGRLREVLDTLSTARIKLLHVAAHGVFSRDNPDDAQLALDDNQVLRPADLAGKRSINLRRERPLVFLNACEGGQLGFALTGLGGWAERLVNDIGVSAFVGALWEVNDQLAATFAIHFYNQLIAGQPLAAAFQSARLAIRGQAPANPTWLAYTLYADPNARVTWSALRA